MQGSRLQEVLLVGHGTIENLDDLPEFLKLIRRGRAAPPELVVEIRRHYEAIGGRSPLNDISQKQASELSKRLGCPVRLAMRFWHPFVSDVVSDMAERGRGIGRLVVVALAPYSASLYAGEVARAVEMHRSRSAVVPVVVPTPSYGTNPHLVNGFSRALRDTLAALVHSRRERAHVVFSAHSLPVSVIRAGDSYQAEIERAATAVATASGISNRWSVAFQSQGASNEPWIGPTLAETFDAIARDGGKDVVVCPIGFIADHVEILFDLDIEAQSLASVRGLTLYRTASLNAEAAMIDTLASVAGAALDPTSPPFSTGLPSPAGDFQGS